MSSLDPPNGSNPAAGVSAVSGPGAPPPEPSAPSTTGPGSRHASPVLPATVLPTIEGPPAPAPQGPRDYVYDPYWHGPPRSERTVRRDQRRQRLTLFMALSALLTALGTVGAIAWGVVHWRHLLTDDGPAASADEEPTRSAGLPATTDDEPDQDEPAEVDVRRDTETQLRGAIEVVDVGVEAGSLEDVLAFHYQVAESKGQTLVVMTTGRKCAPCHGVDDALSHPLMQEALEGIRIVRVDLEVFGDELEALKMPRNLYPAFFLLGDDVRPIDAIHGGEWDEDVAENIAPVLGAFVTGEYKQRRYPDWSPTTTSIPL